MASAGASLSISLAFVTAATRSGAVADFAATAGPF
jgi:hypothetical protein